MNRLGLRSDLRRSALSAAIPLLLCIAAAGPLAAQQPDVAPVARPDGDPAGAAASAVEPQPSIPLPAAEIGPRTRPTASAILPVNLSPWGMFLAADIVVKCVMVGLAFASVVTWSVWLAKSLELLAATRVNRRQIARVAGSGSLAEAGEGVQGSRSAIAALVGAALLETELSASGGAAGLKERVASRLERIEAAAGRRMTRGTGLLATIGSTAPFVGLFGTVWGIMNAFIGISKSQTTNLAVVAPGIAEALLATAIGLVAAIPAVVIYNLFARWITGYRVLLADGAAEVARHVSRDLDRLRVPHLRAAE